MSRVTLSRGRLFLSLAIGALVLLAASVLVARWLRGWEPAAAFFAEYPGTSELPEGTPVGFEPWRGIAHGLNVFFLLFIVRSGLLIYGRRRPPFFVTRPNDGRIRTGRPPRRLSIHVWWHLVVDTAWVVNGLVYVVLLFATGAWLRLVPTTWDVVPNAVSALIQYLSLDWPVHDGWVAYNDLQLLLYFATVFVAAPVAIVTGLRLSPAWPLDATRLNRIYPERLARTLHVWTLVYVIGFAVVHVALVLTTGALRNLNHMYAARDADGWLGFGIFAATVVVMVAAWVLLRPAVLARLAAATRQKVQ